MTEPDWIAQVRDSWQEEIADSRWVHTRDAGEVVALVQRLLAAAEALRELVALRESRVLMDSPGVEASWERAREALGGEGGGDA